QAQDRPDLAREEVRGWWLSSRLRLARGRSDELHRRAAGGGRERAPAQGLLRGCRGRRVRPLALSRRRERPSRGELERRDLPEDEHDGRHLWHGRQDRRRTAGM